MKSVNVEKENINVRDIIRNFSKFCKMIWDDGIINLMGLEPIGGKNNSEVAIGVSEVEAAESKSVEELEKRFDYSNVMETAEKESKSKRKNKRKTYSEVRTEVTKSNRENSDTRVQNSKGYERD